MTAKTVANTKGTDRLAMATYASRMRLLAILVPVLAKPATMTFTPELFTASAYSYQGGVCHEEA